MKSPLVKVNLTPAVAKYVASWPIDTTPFTLIDGEGIYHLSLDDAARLLAFTIPRCDGTIEVSHALRRALESLLDQLVEVTSGHRIVEPDEMSAGRGGLGSTPTPAVPLGEFCRVGDLAPGAKLFHAGVVLTVDPAMFGKEPGWTFLTGSPTWLGMSDDEIVKPI